MSQSKKPVIVVAIFLVALILLPVIIWVVSKVGATNDAGAISQTASGPASAGAAAVDYDLNQLAEKAEKLMSEDIAAALRKGDVSLDFVAGLKHELEKANSDLRGGKLERARERFLSLVTAAENQLAAIGAADKARALQETTYAELQRLDPLRAKF